MSTEPLSDSPGPGEDQPLDGLPLDGALRLAARRLAAAGIVSARAEAELLAVHAFRGADGAEPSRGQIAARALVGSAVAPDGYEDLIATRAERVPLQHLTGRAPFRHLTLSVGPGVFVPRPETEILIDHLNAYVGSLETPDRAVIVDLATGSGALALAAAHENPGSRVIGVELSETAAAWARRNASTAFALAGEPAIADRVEIRTENAARALPGWEGAVDAVVTNPPYIPTAAVPRDPEVAHHDPEMALYGGSADGMAIPTAFVRRAARLLRPGGLLIMEHAEVQEEPAAALFASEGFTDVVTVPDLTGRPRATKGYAGG